MASDRPSPIIAFPIVSGPRIASSLINACLMHVSQGSGVKRDKSRNHVLLDDLGRFRLWAHGFNAFTSQLVDNTEDLQYPAQTTLQDGGPGAVNIQFDEVLERSEYLKEPTMVLLASFASCLLHAKFNKSISPTISAIH